MSGVRQFVQLANDLSTAGARIVPTLRSAMAQGGREVEQVWRANATATAGVHGKHYPASITSQLAFSVSSIAVDIYPDPAKKQGGMSFEFGSRNQPPHLDGEKAVTATTPAVEALIAAAMAGVFTPTAAPTSAGSGLVDYTTRDGRSIRVSASQAAAYARSRR